MIVIQKYQSFGFKKEAKYIVQVSGSSLRHWKLSYYRVLTIFIKQTSCWLFDDKAWRPEDVALQRILPAFSATRPLVNGVISCRLPATQHACCKECCMPVTKSLHHIRNSLRMSEVSGYLKPCQEISPCHSLHSWTDCLTSVRAGRWATYDSSICFTHNLPKKSPLMIGVMT